MLSCPVCHCENWVSLNAESKRYYKKIDCFAHIHPVRKVPLSLTQKVTSPNSGGCKHFKVQLCDKGNAWRYLDVNVSSWPPCPQLVFFTPFWLLVSDWHQCLSLLGVSLYLVSLRVSDEGRAHILSSGLPQGRRDCCHLESYSALRRVRMREKYDACFKIV